MLFTFPVCRHFPVCFCREYDISDFGIFLMWVAGCLGFIVILCLFLISGLLPVVSCVLIDNLLIINDIPICRLCAFSSWSCGQGGQIGVGYVAMLVEML